MEAISTGVHGESSLWERPAAKYSLITLVALAAIATVVIGALAYSKVHFGIIGEAGSIAMMTGGSLLLVGEFGVVWYLRSTDKSEEVSTQSLKLLDIPQVKTAPLDVIKDKVDKEKVQLYQKLLESTEYVELRLKTTNNKQSDFYVFASKIEFIHNKKLQTHGFTCVDKKKIETRQYSFSAFEENHPLFSELKEDEYLDFHNTTKNNLCIVQRKKEGLVFLEYSRQFVKKLKEEKQVFVTHNDLWVRAEEKRMETARQEKLKTGQHLAPPSRENASEYQKLLQEKEYFEVLISAESNVWKVYTKGWYHSRAEFREDITFYTYVEVFHKELQKRLYNKIEGMEEGKVKNSYLSKFKIS